MLALKALGPIPRDEARESVWRPCWNKRWITIDTTTGWLVLDPAFQSDWDTPYPLGYKPKTRKDTTPK